jgi:hypothetical protein
MLHPAGGKTAEIEIVRKDGFRRLEAIKLCEQAIFANPDLEWIDFPGFIRILKLHV